VAAGGDVRQPLHPELPEHRHGRLVVVQGDEEDAGALGVLHGPPDALQLRSPPFLFDDGEHVTLLHEEGVVRPDVLRALLDDAEEAQAIVELPELHLLQSDPQRHPPLLAPLRPELVRLGLLTAVRRGVHQVPGGEDVVQVPEVVGHLHLQLDLPLEAVLMQYLHRGEMPSPAFMVVPMRPALDKGGRGYA